MRSFNHAKIGMPRKHCKRRGGNPLCSHNLPVNVVRSQVATLNLPPHKAFAIGIAEEAIGMPLTDCLHTSIFQARMYRYMSLLEFFYLVETHGLVLRTIITAVARLCVLGPLGC